MVSAIGIITVELVLSLLVQCNNLGNNLLTCDAAKQTLPAPGTSYCTAAHQLAFAELLCVLLMLHTIVYRLHIFSHLPPLSTAHSQRPATATRSDM